MSRSRFFAGLAAIALLAGAASLAQAQATFTSDYWNTTGPAAWSSSANWTTDTYYTFPGTVPYTTWWYGASFITGGTATIGTGDNVTDNSGNGLVFIGGASTYVGGTGGNGYVTMTDGIVNGPTGGTKMQEILGFGTSTAVFTQSGGINVPYAGATDNGQALVPTFTTLQLGYYNGGYGEYDMSGGSLGANVIFAGGNSEAPHNAGGQAMLNAGTGVFNQTGGSVGSLGTPGGSNNAVGLMVGGNWSQNGGATAATTYSSLGSYTLGNADGTPSRQRPISALRRRHRGDRR